MQQPSTSSLRVRVAHDAPIHSGDYVLYWMTSARRLHHNHALQHAQQWASLLAKPLVIFEPLRVGYRWACDRFHAFVIDGMREHQQACAQRGIAYVPYVEPHAGAAKGLLQALSESACVVVTDEYPVYFLPSLLRAGQRACASVKRRLDVVDGNGLLPMRAADDKCCGTAYAFRRVLQQRLPPLLHLSEHDPLPTTGNAPMPNQQLAQLLKRWPSNLEASLADLPINHQVASVTLRGGHASAHAQLQQFVLAKLSGYAENRSEPDQDAASGLSPWLHFGHIGVDEVFAAVAKHEQWTPAKAGSIKNGSRAGFWGMSPAAESFIDELITWRELGFHHAMHHPHDNDRYESLPAWARASLDKHANDAKPYTYSVEQLAQSQTHDPLWNAAQTQLRQEGIMQNYLRMLWGKKILEWSSSPQVALESLIELNNRYALDGRDPNSYSGIFWCLGRFDRPWAPERPTLGVIRYMSSDNTAKKFSVKKYLARYGDGSLPIKKSKRTPAQATLL
jgi:deoxyribodipyrimidine photo-lyase